MLLSGIPFAPWSTLSIAPVNSPPEDFDTWTTSRSFIPPASSVPCHRPMTEELWASAAVQARTDAIKIVSFFTESLRTMLAYPALNLDVSGGSKCRLFKKISGCADRLLHPGPQALYELRSQEAISPGGIGGLVPR